MFERFRQWFVQLEKRVAALPPVLNAIVTSGFHGLQALVIALAWGGGFASFAAPTSIFLYRELEQLFRGRGTAPWYDRVLDVLVPALVGLAVWLL